MAYVYCEHGRNICQQCAVCTRISTCTCSTCRELSGRMNDEAALQSLNEMVSERRLPSAQTPTPTPTIDADTDRQITSDKKVIDRILEEVLNLRYSNRLILEETMGLRRRVERLDDKLDRVDSAIESKLSWVCYTLQWRPPGLEGDEPSSSRSASHGQRPSSFDFSHGQPPSSSSN